jgi:hypothetical protein
MEFDLSPHLTGAGQESTYKLGVLLATMETMKFDVSMLTRIQIQNNMHFHKKTHWRITNIPILVQHPAKSHFG